MKINYDYKRSPETQAYIDMMVAQKSKTPKIKPSTIQSASTQRILDMNEEELIQHKNRQIDLSKAIAAHPATIERKISPEEYYIYRGSQSGSKNTFGQSDDKGYSEEKKHKAMEAFTYSQPAPLSEVQLEKVTRIEPIKELKSLPKEKKQNLLDKIKNWFKPELERPKSFFDKLSKEEQEAWASVAGKEKK